MDKHAYLIIAHNNWENLKILVQLLDDIRNDIYLHIDKNAAGFDAEQFLSLIKYSKIKIYSEIKVHWGGYSMIQCELLLLKKSISHEYQYYHIMSGADLPIKTQDDIHEFFQKNAGYEFIHFEPEEYIKNNASIKRRVSLYHLLQEYRRGFSSPYFNCLFTFAEKVLLAIQVFVHINRWKDSIQLRYGSNWVSITHKLAVYLIEKEAVIQKKFHKTSCADELFIQTLVFNSEFQEKVYQPDNNQHVTGNMRLIDWRRGNHKGSPYTWHEEDFDEIMSSGCLYARKFDYRTDSTIILNIAEKVKRSISRKDVINL